MHYRNRVLFQTHQQQQNKRQQKLNFLLFFVVVVPAAGGTYSTNTYIGTIDLSQKLEKNHC